MEYFKHMIMKQELLKLWNEAHKAFLKGFDC